MEMAVCLTLLHDLRLFPSYWFTLSSLDMRDFVSSYFILFYLVWLLPLGGLLFSEQNPEGEYIWRRGRWQQLGGVREQKPWLGYMVCVKNPFSIRKS